MMKKIILLVLLFSFQMNVFAQRPVLSEDFSFSFGEKYKNIKSRRKYYVAHGNQLLSVKKGKKSMTIQRYGLEDLKENLKFRQVVEDKGDFETVLKLGYRAVAFYSIKNRVYAQFISLTNKSISKPTQLINEKEGVERNFSFQGTYDFDAGGRIHKFAFKKSPDGNKLLILYRLKSEEENKERIVVQVFNDKLELDWKKKILLPIEEKKLLKEDFTIDNEGNFYMTASIFENEKKDKLKEKYTSSIYVFNKESQELKSNTIALNVAIEDAVIIKKGAKTAVTGFFTSDSDKEIAAGIFTLDLGKEGSVTNLRHTLFPEETLAKLMAEREERINEGTQKKTSKRDFQNLRINKIYTNDDGSQVILAEQRYVTRHSTSSSSGGRIMFRNYYTDIYAFKILSNGQIAWMQKMPKYQMGMRGKGSMSYYSFKSKGEYYLLYVDDFTNLKKEFQETPTKYYDGKKEFLYLTAYIINDNTGEVEKQPVLTGRDVRNSRLEHLEISKMTKLHNNFIMEAFDGKKNNLLIKLSEVK